MSPNDDDVKMWSRVDSRVIQFKFKLIGYKSAGKVQSTSRCTHQEIGSRKLRVDKWILMSLTFCKYFIL